MLSWSPLLGDRRVTKGHVLTASRRWLHPVSHATGKRRCLRGVDVSLEGATRSVWAKSARDDTGRVTHWLPLTQHLADSLGVAERLVAEWVPGQVVDTIARDLPGGRADVALLTGWLAAVHDVGKASPAFAVQVDSLADVMRRTGLAFSPLLAKDPMRGKVTHALVGHLALVDWLRDRVGWTPRRGGSQLAAIVGGHHGVPPESSQLQDVRVRNDLAGDGLWTDIREELLDWAAERTGAQGWLHAHQGTALSQCSQVLLSALVIVADWIASDAELFPLRPAHDTELSRPADPDRAAAAWDCLALPPPWRPEPVTLAADAWFAARFTVASPPRPVQIAVVETMASRDETGLLIVEAPMGEGKTEAALLAAEAMAQRSGAGGCFIALPTQATSDAMFARVRAWLDRLPGEGTRSVYLAHGRNALNEDYDGLPCRALVSIGVDESSGANRSSCTQIAHSWLRGRKKGVLASFVVGTIDQVLFAGLKSRHLVLRHLALAGKVVIIDEAHAYDVYMSQYLDRVLRWLGAYGVPVVMLSATLPARRRAELLVAYEGGAVDESESDGDVAYPLLTATNANGQRSRTVVPASGRASTVALEHLGDQDDLIGWLQHRLADGGCALVVRNTVARVQETARALEEAFGETNVTVHHARFLACDRARTDRDLLRKFGPPSTSCRPSRHVVVGSQVVEQSLDIDFDVLVTDLAPVDLVLQRMGRLHRHARAEPRPERLRTPTCALVGVDDWDGGLVQPAAGSARVYELDALLRSAATLGPWARKIVRLPEDIAPLVSLAYGDVDFGPDDWREPMRTARTAAVRRAARSAETARTFRVGEPAESDTSLVGWLRANIGEADDSPSGQAQVRDSDESIEVLVVQSDGGTGLMIPSWIERGAETPIPMDQKMPDHLAKIVSACSLRLPPAMCHPGVIDAVIKALELNRFTSFHQHRLLKGQLVLVLASDRTALLTCGGVQFLLQYDVRRGLLHEKR